MIGLEKLSAGRIVCFLRSSVPFAVVFAFGILAALANVSTSGDKLPDDGAVYANNGAMLHDWFRSGKWTDPYGFAQKNYVQYPAFGVPYHPPGYACLLGAWFLVFGLSYIAARWFVAVSLGVLACCFLGVLKRQEIPTSAAIVGTLLLITSPEIALWGQTTMSEIPSMLFLVGGTYCFVRWVNSSQSRWCWLAFLWAGFAFYCRVLSAGMLPAWFVFLLICRKWKLLFSPHLIAASALYLINGISWSIFASKFAKHEVRPAELTDLSSLSLEGVATWGSMLPLLMGWATLILAAVGSFCWRSPKYRQGILFWLLCLATHWIFLVAIGLHYESRFFVYAAPAICGLAAFAMSRLGELLGKPALITGIGMLVVAFNAVKIADMPAGVSGYDHVAAKVAELTEPGNVLVCSWYSSNFIFQYRCVAKGDRQIVRGDRTLAIRVGGYADVDTDVIADSTEDVMDIIRRGRVRYLLTCASKQKSLFDEMALAHKVATSSPDQFALIDRFVITFDMPRQAAPKTGEIFLWTYLGELEQGPSELPVNIPTAEIHISPGSSTLR